MIHYFRCRDPAARRIGLFLFITLVLATIGAALGIGLGNISHAREFDLFFISSQNDCSFSSIQGYFSSASQLDVLDQSLNISSFFNESFTSTDLRNISPKMRAFWLLMNRPLN